MSADSHAAPLADDRLGLLVWLAVGLVEDAHRAAVRRVVADLARLTIDGQLTREDARRIADRLDAHFQIDAHSR